MHNILLSYCSESIQKQLKKKKNFLYFDHAPWVGQARGKMNSGTFLHGDETKAL